MNENGDAYDRERFEQLVTDLHRDALREAPGRDEHLGGPCARSGLRNLKERAKQRVPVRMESA